jgi:uncharacterized sulfatase
MPDRPDIVLVTTDSQGWNAMGACGEGEGFVETPRLDALADDGVCFENAYVTAPVCGPSRTGLYTGQYPHAVGAWTNGLGIEAGVETAGEHLRRAGYRTAYVGKWHLDGDYFGDGEAAPGYEPEYWYDGADYRADVGEAFWVWYRSGMNSRVAESDIDGIHERGITREDTWAGRITDRALAFLDDAAGDDRPFFLAVNYDEPHEPATCPPPYCDRYRDRRYPLPDNHETPGDVDAAGKPERQRAFAEAYAEGNAFMDSLSDAERDGGISRPLYFGCVEFVDSEIGRVLDATPDDAVTAFTSDHGHYLGAHGLDLKHFALYDEVTNVPLIVRGPSLPAGANTDALVSHVDLLPTVLDIAGADDPDLHGRSFLPAARDPSRSHRDVALVEHNGYGQARADGDGLYPVRALVSAEGYKLVCNLLETDEFYDLDADPGELDNRIDDPDPHLTAVRDRLHDRLLATMADTGDAFHGQAWADRAWRDVAEPTHPG